MTSTTVTKNLQHRRVFLLNTSPFLDSSIDDACVLECVGARARFCCHIHVGDMVRTRTRLCLQMVLQLLNSLYSDDSA